jgi:nucleoside-diphosphate-sugar epimerase
LKKKILITGINGFLGSHLAMGLKDSFEVIGLVNSINNVERIKEFSFKLYSFKKDEIESIFLENNFHAVLHTATVYKRENEPLMNLLRTNIVLPVQLLELCKKYKVPSFLNTDSFFNNKEYKYSYLSDYTLSKQQVLTWIKLLSVSTSCKVVNMKIFHMYGEHDSLNKFIPSITDMIKNNKSFLNMTPGEQTRDFIYVKDVVSAFDIVLNSVEKLKEYQEFEIGSGKSYTIKKLAELIKEITGSNTDLRFGALSYRDGEIMASQVNNFDLTNKYNWNPIYSLRKGFKTYLK